MNADETISPESPETPPSQPYAFGNAPQPQEAPAPVQAPTGTSPETSAVHEEVKPREERDEIDRLDPTPTPLILESGTHYSLSPMKLRQFLRLLKIITTGSGDILERTSLDMDDPEAFAQTLITLVLFSVPEAEDEVIDFIQSMVFPANLSGNAQLDERAMQNFYEAELSNPSLEDTLTIIQSIVENEAEDIRKLGKRLARMMETAQKMGALGR